MNKWGEQYNLLLEEYKSNDPVQAVIERLPVDTLQKDLDVLFILPVLKQAIGGIHTVLDILNYLTLQGLNASFAVPQQNMLEYQESFLFSPVLAKNYYALESLEVKPKLVVATAWDTFAPAFFLAQKHKAQLVYFIQGYEAYFLNGTLQGIVSETYRIPSHKIVVSNWLKERLARFNQKDIAVLPTGYNPLLFYPDPSKTPTTTADTVFDLLFVLRGSTEKGDWIAKEVIALCQNISKVNNINVLYTEPTVFDIEQDDKSKITLIHGPLSQSELRDLLQKTDIYLDFSTHEGFGLIPLEAMACGAVVITSASGGINDSIPYSELIVKEINSPESYIEKLKDLTSSFIQFESYRQKSLTSTGKFHFSDTLPKYMKRFTDIIELEGDTDELLNVQVEQNRSLIKHRYEVCCQQTSVQHENYTSLLKKQNNKLVELDQKWDRLKHDHRQLQEKYDSLQEAHRSVTASKKWRFICWVIRVFKDRKFSKGR